MGSVAMVTCLLAILTVSTAQLFTVNCAALTIQRGDPIVSPGQISSHVHSVVGGTAFQQTESSQTAINAKNTTCDKNLDHSNYWVPQLYHQNNDGSFSLVTFQGNAAYYLSRACDYKAGLQNCNNQPYPRAPPAGLRMVAGNPTLRTYNSSNAEQRAIQHVCLGNPGGNFPSLPPMACDRLRSEVFFPSCWDGKNLDSTSHKSHVAYPAIGDYNGGVCPATHPIAIYSVFYEFFFDTSAIKDYNRLVWAMGDPTGYGFHGDFINGWTDQNRLERAMNTCTGPNGVNDAGCSLNIGPNAPGRSSSQVPEVAAPSEDVGLHGPIAKLPGNNPVTGTFPQKRFKQW